MAHIKTGAATSGNRDSKAKRLGIKLYGGQKATSGNIIVRQRGTKFLPGRNVKRGSDDTLYANKTGTVKFTTRLKKLFNGTQRRAKVVHVEPGK